MTTTATTAAQGTGDAESDRPKETLRERYLRVETLRTKKAEADEEFDRILGDLLATTGGPGPTGLKEALGRTMSDRCHRLRRIHGVVAERSTTRRRVTPEPAVWSRLRSLDQVAKRATAELPSARRDLAEAIDALKQQGVSEAQMANLLGTTRDRLKNLVERHRPRRAHRKPSVWAGR